MRLVTTNKTKLHYIYTVKSVYLGHLIKKTNWHNLERIRVVVSRNCDILILYFFHNLYDIFIFKYMIFSNFLRHYDEVYYKNLQYFSFHYAKQLEIHNPIQVCKFIPPLSFRRYTIFGGDLFSLNPNPSNSCSINFLCFNGLRTSKTIKINEHVRATAITCLPRPLPSFAPSIIPASPVLATSKPSPVPPPPPLGVMSSRRSLAIRAFSKPKCPALLTSASMAEILSSIVDMFKNYFNLEHEY
ncbi:hypothetical protein AGLY_007433 [Aphis glycines]|uniref:Uncharacterized protein n=1 Tax=Aphis glycines TaxID=307491 RepID=A0A6G0TM06_APHGL|nr:hypothetical protein AGLY_007433 [Aphis glycines]